MSTWFSKPNQSLISKVTEKSVGFNLKIFVFAPRFALLLDFNYPVKRRCKIFVFVLFENIGERASEAIVRERVRSARNKIKVSFLLPHPYSLALAVNKSAVFVFYHARSTDFEEKIEFL